MTDIPNPSAARVVRRHLDPGESARASRTWWEGSADDYQAEHGGFLRDSGFVWCPEGLDEAEARLLGDIGALRESRVVEIGCGAAQCARWLRTRGVRVVGIDLAWQQLRNARRIDARSGTRVPVAQADVRRLPFATESFDVACSAYGAFPFVADAAAALREVARILRPGGRLVFSVSHPVRWCFPDDPTEDGLVVRDSYFDRRAYVEEDATGTAIYVEHHHTVGDWVRAVAGAGLRLVDLVEPEWPEGHERVWGGWSPLRGRLLPGTAIFVSEKEGPRR